MAEGAAARQQAKSREVELVRSLAMSLRRSQIAVPWSRIGQRQSATLCEPSPTR